ncbi:MAG: hypothetical protein R2828_03660 [Saprospiraceae bacterium]
MKNSHLVAILQTFSKKEIREMRKWLHSPIHNQREDVVDLFDYLMAGKHLSEEKFLEKEKIFPKLFPNQSYDDAKFRQTVHFLLKSTEEFLVVCDLLKNKTAQQVSLTQNLRRRNLEKPFFKSLQEAKNVHEASQFRNFNFYRNEYLIQLEQYTSMEGKERMTEMNLQEVSDSLDIYFIAEKLKESCRMIFHQHVYKVQYKIGLLNEIITHIESNPELLNIPAISIYYYVFKAITAENSSGYFENIRTQIQNNGNYFPPSEIKEIYLMAINYCIGKANTGRGDIFIKHTYEFFKHGFENKIFVENGIISRFTFRNAISAALRMKEYDWVNYFIHAFKDFLEEPYRESFFLHGLARLKFESKQYEEAMKLLVSTNFDDLLTNLNAKTMLLKMYYELDEDDALDSLLESMRTYIHRKKVMGYHKENYQNLIRYTKKIARVNPFKKEDVKALKTEILTAIPLTEKDWLLQQLDNL